MSRTKLEVADIFRGHGPAWRQANAGHVSLEQLKVMSAIENCRTAELGGHVVRCENETCGHTEIGYLSAKAIPTTRRLDTCGRRRPSAMSSRGAEGCPPASVFRRFVKIFPPRLS